MAFGHSHKTSAASPGSALVANTGASARMKRRHSVGLLALVFAICPLLEPASLADELGPPAVEKQRIQSWVRQLGSDRFEIREKATRQLIAAGSKATPLLVDEMRTGASN